MILYNLITELISVQFVLIALFEIIAVVVSAFVFKIRPTKQILLVSIIFGIVLSLLSIIVVRGSYGGMAYHERFGWPFQYHFVSRDIEIGTNVAIPYAFRFDLLKFIANTIFWSFIPIITMLSYKQKRKSYKIFVAGAVLFFIFLTIGCWYSNVIHETREIESEGAVIEVEPPSTILFPPDKNTDKEVVSIKRHIIELEYPDFKDSENQKSFAGQSVKIVNDDSEYYFAYIVYGSGLPIAKATCFRADSIKAYKIGEFPDLADSFIGYKDIDPKTCKGIK